MGHTSELPQESSVVSEISSSDSRVVGAIHIRWFTVAEKRSFVGIATLSFLRTFIVWGKPIRFCDVLTFGNGAFTLDTNLGVLHSSNTTS